MTTSEIRCNLIASASTSNQFHFVQLLCTKPTVIRERVALLTSAILTYHVVNTSKATRRDVASIQNKQHEDEIFSRSIKGLKRQNITHYASCKIIGFRFDLLITRVEVQHSNDLAPSATSIDNVSKSVARQSG